MDLHHEMVLALLQRPDNGSDKLLKISHAQADLTSWMRLTLGRAEHKGESQNFALTTQSGRRDLYTDNPFPEIMN